MHPRKRYPTVARRLADPQVVRELSRQDTARWLRAVGGEWLCIAAVVGVCAWVPGWLSWLVGAIVIGTRQHALSILGHEGVHRLISSRRRVNDTLANWLTLYPLLITVQGYRSSHMDHHWYLETPDDPSRISVMHHPRDWSFPMTRRHVVGMFARDLSGLSQASSATLLKYLWQIADPYLHVMGIFVVQVAVAAALTLATGVYWAYPVLWLAPLFTIVVACYRVRAIAEHSAFGDGGDRYQRSTVDPLLRTRTTIVEPGIAGLLAPYHVSYHIEHHMHPSVTCFNLKRLHEHLLPQAAYRRQAHVTRGYRGLLREMQGTSAAPP